MIYIMERNVCELVETKTTKRWALCLTVKNTEKEVTGELGMKTQACIFYFGFCFGDHASKKHINTGLERGNRTVYLCM